MTETDPTLPPESTGTEITRPGTRPNRTAAPAPPWPFRAVYGELHHRHAAKFPGTGDFISAPTFGRLWVNHRHGHGLLALGPLTDPPYTALCRGVTRPIERSDA